MREEDVCWFYVCSLFCGGLVCAVQIVSIVYRKGNKGGKREEYFSEDAAFADEDRFCWLGGTYDACFEVQQFFCINVLWDVWN